MQSILTTYKKKSKENLIYLVNRMPIWSASKINIIVEKNKYTMDFKGRVTKSSSKNFQLTEAENSR